MTTATASVDQRVIAFMGELVLPSGQRIAESFDSDPWVLERVVIPALTSRYLYCEMPKASGKSTIAGGLSLVEGIMHPGTHSYVVACDVEQGAIIIEVLAELISRFPRLKAMIKQRGNEFRFSNGSFVRVLSSDVPSSHGLGATARRLRFVLDEWTQWQQPGMFHSLMSTMAKVPDSAMRIFCNAGIVGSWQQDARDQLRATGAHMFITESGWLPSWVRREDIEQLRATLPEVLWRRYFLNEWQAEASQAITAEAWDACRADLPALDATTQLVVGVDAALYHDSFAIVAVSRHRARSKPKESHIISGATWALYDSGDENREPDEIWMRECRIWTAEGGVIDFEEIYRWLGDFVPKHRVVCVTYDIWQLADWARRFGEQYGVWMEPFDQGSPRAQGDSDLLQLIASRRLKHPGDPILREHALAAAFRVSPREDTRGRFIKSHPSKRIDGLVATSMAAAQAMHLLLD